MLAWPRNSQPIAIATEIPISTTAPTKLDRHDEERYHHQIKQHT
jgi:hypothetical protein